VRPSPPFSKFLTSNAHHIKNGDCYLFAGWRYPLQKGKQALMEEQVKVARFIAKKRRNVLR